MNSNQPEAGPSRQYAEIPSYGPQFFEYRRRLFLANLPLPEPYQSPALPSKGGSRPSSAHSNHLKSKYRIPIPLPDPLPAHPNAPSPNSSAGKLEALLADEAAEETLAVWKGGLGVVHAKLTSGKTLTRPLRLGLVIKVLKAGWIRDGTWPMDPTTSRATRPPDSPFLGPIPPLRTTSMVPDLGLPAALATDDAEAGESVADDRDVQIGGDVWRGAREAIPISRNQT